jgi:hypothetical protein
MTIRERPGQRWRNLHGRAANIQRARSTHGGEGIPTPVYEKGTGLTEAFICVFMPEGGGQFIGGQPPSEEIRIR